MIFLYLRCLPKALFLVLYFYHIQNPSRNSLFHLSLITVIFIHLSFLLLSSIHLKQGITRLQNALQQISFWITTTHSTLIQVFQD